MSEHEGLNITSKERVDDPDFPFFETHKNWFIRGIRHYNVIRNPQRLEKVFKVRFDSSTGISLDLSSSPNSEGYVNAMKHYLGELEGSPQRDLQNRKIYQEMKAVLAGFGKAAFDAGDFYTAVTSFDAAKILDYPHVEQVIKENVKDAGKGAKKETVRAYKTIRVDRRNRSDDTGKIDQMIDYMSD